jgi:hypothetical protein
MTRTQAPVSLRMRELESELPTGKARQMLRGRYDNRVGFVPLEHVHESPQGGAAGIRSFDEDRGQHEALAIGRTDTSTWPTSSARSS